jgi:hypothetical protein
MGPLMGRNRSSRLNRVMSKESFRYDILAQEALRGVVRSVLQRVEKRGLPGDHHFVITFDTHAPGVAISKRLRDRYPIDMTIVIQYQFWGLKVYEHAFELGLSFNNIPEILVIPFRAVKSFQDPSVGFMLHFAGFSLDDSPADEDHDLLLEGGVAGDSVELIEPPVLPSPAARPALPEPPRSANPDKPAETTAKDAPVEKPGAKPKSADVVQLDSFRKK